MKLIYLVLALWSLIHCSVEEDECDRIIQLVEKTLKGGGYLELMNSPLLVSWSRKQLRVMFDMPTLPGDTIRVIEQSSANRTVFQSDVPASSNYIDTATVYDDTKSYAAEYLRSNGTVIGRSEFKNWSGWMYCIREFLGPRSLGTVLFPGTHDSGSYRQPQPYDSILLPLTFIFDYIFTQDETIEEQLERGARYLDLRIADYGLFSDFWFVNHGIAPIRPLSGVIQQINDFMSRWPNEILLLDVHRFPFGIWSNATHERLAKYLSDSFGSLLYKPANQSAAWSITFSQLWDTKARILLSFDDADVASKFQLMPPVSQVWANADKSQDLYDYLNATLPRTCHLDEMTSAMAELTPQVHSIFGYGGLRNLANEVNSQVTLDFLLGPWGQTSQAVAVDFLSSTGIISAAIVQNVNRSLTHPDHPCR